jgi:hypothetical protein
MTGEHGGLVEQVGIEVLVAGAGSGRVQRRISEVDAARVREDLGIDSGDLFGKPEESGSEMNRVNGRVGPTVPCRA